MRDAAREYVNATGCLSGVVGSFGSSVPLLKTLALEVYLKAVYRVDLKQRPEFGHQLLKGFLSLSSATQHNILTSVAEQIGPSAMNDPEVGHDRVLLDLERNFVAYRYEFEDYERLGRVGFLTAEEGWLRGGSNLPGARFRFWPDEAGAMCQSCDEFLQEWLSTRRS